MDQAQLLELLRNAAGERAVDNPALTQAARDQLPPMGRLGKTPLAPGAESYIARLDKCRSVSPERRTANEMAFVAGAALLDEAAAVLVPLAESGSVPDGAWVRAWVMKALHVHTLPHNATA